MSQKNERAPLRLFLTSVCRVLKDGKTENCSCIEEQLQKGIATYLLDKYPHAFDRSGFNQDYTEEIDEYYRNCLYPISGDADRKYDCDEKEGLWLVIQLALDEIC